MWMISFWFHAELSWFQRLAGLTVDDRLSCTVEGDAEDDLVLTLCSIQRKNDGHWCFPHIYLPCHVNDAEVHDITLLSQGPPVSLRDTLS